MIWIQIEEKIAKANFGKGFLKLMNNVVFEKLWEMWENVEILNLSQHKEEGIV